MLIWLRVRLCLLFAVATGIRVFESYNVLVFVSHVYFSLPKSSSLKTVYVLALSAVIHWITEALLL